MTARDRIVIALVLVAGFVAAGWFFVLAPQREEAASLAGQIAVQRQTLDGALAEVQAGISAKRTYARDYATVARLGAAVPDDDNTASLLLQIEQAAKASDIDFRSLKAGGGSGAAAPPPPPADPAAATQATTATLPPGAAVGSAGFPTMPFTFTFTGDFFDLSDFVGRLERFLVVRNRALAVSGRFMTLDGIAFNAAPSGFPKIQASVAATTYLVPATQGLTNGATPSGPAPTTTPPSGQTAKSGAPTTATVKPVTP